MIELVFRANPDEKCLTFANSLNWLNPILDNANKEKNFIYCQRDVALP